MVCECLNLFAVEFCGVVHDEEMGEFHHLKKSYVG